MITREPIDKRELAAIRERGPMPAIGRNWIYSGYRQYRKQGLGPWNAMFFAVFIPNHIAMRMAPSFSPDAPDASESMGEYVALVEAWRAERAKVN